MEEIHSRINGERINKRLDELAECSRPGLGVTRLPFTKESASAQKLVEKWMEQAGMTVRRDGINNIIGRYEGKEPNAPVLIIGSHLDTVVEGGKYDGMLGIVTGIEVIQTLFENGVMLNHPIEVIGFCDEEGVRFHSTFLGSRALAGTLTEEDLLRKDDSGISIREALIPLGIGPFEYKKAKRTREEVLGYLELHIEQGPVLEKANESVGVVSGIAGVTRFSFEITGKSGHAGTVPIKLRQDALAGASEFILLVESAAKKHNPLVATVGKLSVYPGASNVIPGLVKGTLDIRDLDENRKDQAINELLIESQAICRARGLQIHIKKIMEIAPVACNDRFISSIQASIQEFGGNPILIISGAGHDAMVMADITDVAMIFVRCKEGLSHHPDEYATEEDITLGAKVLFSTVLKIDNKK